MPSPIVRQLTTSSLQCRYYIVFAESTLHSTSFQREGSFHVVEAQLTLYIMYIHASRHLRARQGIIESKESMVGSFSSRRRF